MDKGSVDVPEISIIIPVFNSEKFLSKCLDSILKQTFSDFELIIVNDGSTDDSLSICKHYLNCDNRIRLFTQKNSGQAAARNRGINESFGEWICFIDSDDVVSPYYLEYLYSAVSKRKVDMCVCGYLSGVKPSTSFFEKGNYSLLEYEITDENMRFLKDKFTNSYWLVWGKMIHRNVVRNDLFITGRIYEDNEIAPKWLYTAKKIVVIDLPLYFYTDNEFGTTKSEFTLKQCDLLWALEEQIKFLEGITFFLTQKDIILLYIHSCNALTKRIREQLNNSLVSKQIMKKARRAVKKYVKYNALSVEQKGIVDNFLHPAIFRLKRKLFLGD